MFVQIIEKDPLQPNGPPQTTLVEIGPRFVLTPIRIFEGAFGGATVFSNPGRFLCIVIFNRWPILTDSLSEKNLSLHQLCVLHLDGSKAANITDVKMQRLRVREERRCGNEALMSWQWRKYSLETCDTCPRMKGTKLEEISPNILREANTGENNGNMTL